jgi:phenylalanyl-tRNA synthetase beta chain
MKLPLSWLKEWVDPGLAPRELGSRMTLAGFELESVASAAPAFSGVVVAEILSAERHPQADKLQVCRVSAGGAELQIVCGAANARAGLRTALAQVGAVLPGDLKIKAAKLRGVESAGMLCSAKELGLAEVSDGILELPADASVGTDLRQALDLDDTVLEFAITPNRGDAMSVRGLAREVAALTGAALGGPDCAPVPASAGRSPEGVSALSKGSTVSLSAAAACPRFHHRLLVDIDNSRPSPLWLRERLRRAGQRSISPIVDITNYIVLELGQPMHAYDLDKIEGGALDVRLARVGETCELLDGRTVELAPDVLVIADAAGPVAMAGVMGGMRTSVTPQTTRVMLEVAWFAPAAIAGRGRRYGLTTDASQRFERGVDPELGRQAIERATALMLEVAGGAAGEVKITEVTAEDGAAAVRRAPSVTLRPTEVGRVLGLEMSAAKIVELLSRLGIERVGGAEDGASATDVTGAALAFQSPSHRFDIAIERDLIEEVARLVGFDAIPVVDARVAQAIRSLPARQLEEQRLLDLFAARGWQEGVHFAFVDPALQERVFPGVPSHRLSNPIASDLAVMRLSLWPGLIRAAQENLRRQQGRVRLVEHGVVFPVGAPEADHVAGIAVGARRPEQWGEDAAASDFHDVRADLEALAGLVGHAGAFVFEPASLGCLHPGRSARILRTGQPVGWIGELHPSLVRELGFTTAPVLFELATAAALEVEYPSFAEVSRFPQVRRDLAVVVAEEVPFSALQDVVTSASSSLLRQHFVFDLYRGIGVETGRKSVALGLIFQDKKSTLTEEVVEGEMAAIRGALIHRLGASFRE